MPNMEWSRLNRMQLGRYGEYYAKMEFTSYGFEVYTSEVDDHGVDFVAKIPGTEDFVEVQVKSARDFTYVYCQKEKMPLVPNRLLCYLRFVDGALPEVYLVPARAWMHPDDLLVDRPYGKAGQTSRPEWGLNISKKNLARLEPYRAEHYFASIIKE